VELDNIEFIKDVPYSNMTVIAAISRTDFAVYAVSGNLPDCVFIGGGERSSLVMSFYCTAENESHILRYSISGTALNHPTKTTLPVKGQVKRGFIDERGSVVRVVTDLGDSAALFMFDSAMNTIGTRVEKIAANETIIGAAFDENAVYVISGEQASHQIYAIDISDPNNPVFMNNIDSPPSNETFHKWSDERFFAVRLNEERQVTITMYSVHNGTAGVEATLRLPLEDEVWYDSVRTSVEWLWDNIAVSYDPSAATGVIVIPVTYFNVQRIESFFVLNYIQDVGFGKVGSIVDITGLRYNRELAAVVRGGYIYTIWDNLIESARLDSTTITSYSFG
jgi:hypothetical protein